MDRVSFDLSQIYYKNNRLQQIRGFCNVVDLGSIKKASDAMGLTQSTISLQIKTLERDLKKNLIHRDKKNSKHFSLTEDGRKFYEMALPILQATDSLYEKFFIETGKNNKQTLKISGHHSVFDLLIAKNLKNLKKNNKNLKLELSYLTTTESFKNLSENTLDIAIYPIENTELLPREFLFTKVANYNPALILPKNHPLAKTPDKEITFEKIGKYNYIHTGKYAISDIMKYNITSKTLKGDIVLNNGSWDTLRSLVAANLGVTIFHKDYCRKSNDIITKNVNHLSPKIAYYAIYKNSCKMKKPILQLIEDIIKTNL